MIALAPTVQRILFFFVQNFLKYKCYEIFFFFKKKHFRIFRGGKKYPCILEFIVWMVYKTCFSLKTSSGNILCLGYIHSNSGCNINASGKGLRIYST